MVQPIFQDKYVWQFLQQQIQYLCVMQRLEHQDHFFLLIEHLSAWVYSLSIKLP